MAGAQIGNPKPQFFDASGNPLAGGTLTVYLAGTTTTTNTWQDRAQTTLNTNPITLDARGECSLWLDNSLTYKFVLKNALGVEQWTYDNLVGSVAGAASAVTFVQAGTGAVTRTAQDKMRERISLKDFGAALDGTTNDYTAWTTAIAALSEGDTLYIDGPFYYTTAIVLTKNINVICVGERGYFKPSVGANDAFTFRPAAHRKVSMVLAMYGGASSCTNGIVLDNVTESDFLISMAVGATSHGIRTLGCLNCNFDFDISTNRSAPSGSGAAMPAKHLYIGASIADPAKPACNACFYKLYFGGGGQGIESADASSQGNSTFKGTIEGNTGPAFSFLGNKGLRLQELHVESSLSTASSVTNCVDLAVEKVTTWGPAAANNMLNVTGCSAFVIDKYSGSLNIDSTSRNGELGTISRGSMDTFANASSSVQQVGPVNSLTGSTNSGGQAGAFHLENLFHNPYVDLYDAAASAPVGFLGTLVTYGRSTTTPFSGNPTGVCLDVTSTATSILDGVTIQPAAPYVVSEEQWISIMLALRIATGQPNVIVYLHNGSAFEAMETVTTRDAYYIVRGAVKVPASGTWYLALRTHNGTAFVAGNYKIGGVNMVRGRNPPKHLTEGSARRHHVIESVAYNPAFKGQSAYVSGTGKWYRAAAATAPADWIILN